MQTNSYILEIYACFYFQVLEEFYSCVDEFDKGAFLYELGKPNTNALNNFLSPQNLKLLDSIVINLSEDYAQKKSELEFEFLKAVIVDFFQSGATTSYEEIRTTLYESDWYKNILYTTSHENTKTIRDQYSWYAQNIHTDTCLDKLKKFFLDKSYIKKGQERGLIDISKLATDARDTFLNIFNQIE